MNLLKTKHCKKNSACILNKKTSANSCWHHRATITFLKHILSCRSMQKVCVTPKKGNFFTIGVLNLGPAMKMPRLEKPLHWQNVMLIQHLSFPNKNSKVDTGGIIFARLFLENLANTSWQ